MGDGKFESLKGGRKDEGMAGWMDGWAFNV